MSYHSSIKKKNRKRKKDKNRIIKNKINKIKIRNAKLESESILGNTIFIKRAYGEETIITKCFIYGSELRIKKHWDGDISCSIETAIYSDPSQYFNFLKNKFGRVTNGLYPGHTFYRTIVVSQLKGVLQPKNLLLEKEYSKLVL